MEIYNIKHLNQDKRFVVAIIAGIVSSIGLGILSGYIRRMIAFGGIELPIIYWAAAYGTAMAIQHFGRGVQPRFSVLGAICALATVLISDVVNVFGFQGLFFIQAYVSIIVGLLLPNIFTMLALLYRAVAVYIGYNYARIL